MGVSELPPNGTRVPPDLRKSRLELHSAPLNLFAEVDRCNVLSLLSETQCKVYIINRREVYRWVQA